MRLSAENDYLNLLRCALWDLRPDLEHIADWNGVLLLAQRQTTLGIVGNAALQSQATQDLLPESRVRLLTHLEKMQNEAEQAEQLLMALNAAFSQHDLSFILLKGLGMAAFYPVPRLRKCGDIDLLGYIRVLRKYNYDGPIDLEVIGAKEYELPACVAIAAESRGHLQACLQAVGER